jgi:predicted HTH domain antitoxin
MVRGEQPGVLAANRAHRRQTACVSVTVNVVVPEGALSVLRTDASGFAEEMKRAAVAKWYEMGMVSQSKGSEILGLSRSEFLDVLSRYRVSPFQSDEEELGEERVHG